MTTVVLPISVILLLVAINGIFVAAEFALVGSRKSRFESFAENGNRSARWLVNIFNKPTGKDGYIAIAQLGITLASIGLGMYGEPAVAKWLYGPLEEWGLSYKAAHTLGFIIALSGITYMHVVFGEMIPKALALQTPEKICLRVNPVMRIFGVLFRPMVAVLNFTAIRLMHLLRIPEPDKSSTLFSSEELAIVTEESADSGQLGEMQSELIQNIFELDERKAQELMTSRSNLEVLEITATEDEIVQRIQNSPRSRYPVFEESLDNIVGVLHIRDFIKAQLSNADMNLKKLVREIPTVSENANAEQLLELFKENRTHAAIVVDEYGGTLGIVTLDDIIADVMEEDIDGDGSKPIHHPDGSISLDGEVTLAEASDDFGIEFIYEDVTTIAGIVLAELSRVPKVNDVIKFQGYELKVERMQGHKITRIRLVPLNSDGY